MKNETVAIIPAFNEEKTIENVIKNTLVYVNKIIVVSDGSSDNTVKKSKSNNVLVIENKKNLGPALATEKGIQKAIELGFKYLVTIDADGQHPYDQIPVFLEKLRKNEGDIVVACRDKFPRFSEYLFSYYSTKRIGVKDPLNGFKAIKGEVIKEIGYFDKIEAMTSQVLFNAKKKGFKLISIPIRVNLREDNPRIGGTIKSNFKILGSLIRMFYNDIFTK